MNPQGGMVSVEDLIQHFLGCPDEILGMIEALGSPQVARDARRISFRKKVELLHALMGEALRVA